MADIKITQADGTVLDLSRLGSELVSVMAQVEIANALWAIVALQREQALTSTLGALRRPTEAIERIEALEMKVTELDGLEEPDIRQRMRALEASRQTDADAVRHLLDDMYTRLRGLEAHQTSLESQHATLAAKSVSEHAQPQNQSSEPSTAGTVTVHTPNAPTDPERQVNLLASMRLLLTEIDPYKPETFQYAEAMVKVVELYFNTEKPAPAAAEPVDFDPWALANQLEREEMSNAPTAEEIDANDNEH